MSRGGEQNYDRYYPKNSKKNQKFLVRKKMREFFSKTFCNGKMGEFFKNFL
jgi:hypothetical protein